MCGGSPLQFGEETANYEREYARFAVQAIVAGYVFKQMDEDKSGELDKEELGAALKDAVRGGGAVQA